MKIAEALGIQKLRSTHVSDNRVVDDGYNLNDVENAIKVIPMQQYLNSTETDVFKLFQTLIDTVEGRVIVANISAEEAEEISLSPGKIKPLVEEELAPIKSIKKSKGRPKKK